MNFTPTDGQHAFEVEVFLGDLSPDAVRVELYADGVNGDGPVRQEMTRVPPLGNAGGCIYRATVPATRPATHYTARVIPRCRRRGSVGRIANPVAAVGEHAGRARGTEEVVGKNSR